MKSFVETVVGGAVGLIALYVVGRVAYEAGREIAREECRYDELKQKNEDLEARIISDEPAAQTAAVAVRRPEKKRTSGIMNVVGMLFRKNTTVGNLIRNPEDHQVEAYVDGEELHLNVRRRTA